jgi:hypothetical protein
VAASTSSLERGAASQLTSDPERTTCLHIVGGQGRLLVGREEEMRRTSPPSISATKGDLFLVAPGAHFGYANEGPDTLRIAEHRIAVSTAFVRG